MSSTTPNVNSTSTLGPANIPSLTIYFQTADTPFSRLSATILPRQHPSALRAFFTYQLTGLPLRSRSATGLIFHSHISAAPTPTQPPAPTPPTSGPSTPPAQPLRITIAACKDRDNSFRVMQPPLTPNEEDLIREGSRLLLNNKMHVQVVGHHALFANVVVFAGREEYTGQVIELWTPRKWATVNERARMGLLMDTSTLHSRLPDVYEDCDPFSPHPI